MSPLPCARRVLLCAFLVTSFTGLGCEPGAPRAEPPRPEAPGEAATPRSPAASAPTPDGATGQEAAKRVTVGKNVTFEKLANGRRRVLVNAAVCLREGQLEQLVCRKRTKEHEAILAADVDARNIHTALLLAGAKPGSTVKYVNKGNETTIVPPTGSRIKVTLQYEDKGKTVTVPAQKWVRNNKTKKDLDVDWVFAGSQLMENPDGPDKPPFYAANSGDVICVSNFETALLDLPINSSKENAELAFEAHTERIPPLETKVLIILEPEPDAKKK